MSNNYFELLANHLREQGLADFGAAAVMVGDSHVVVYYNCDGRLAYHRTQGEVYPRSAPLMSYEGGPLTGQLKSDLVDFLLCDWVQLP
jgi:hypothetical protein